MFINDGGWQATMKRCSNTYVTIHMLNYVTKTCCLSKIVLTDKTWSVMYNCMWRTVFFLLFRRTDRHWAEVESVMEYRRSESYLSFPGYSTTSTQIDDSNGKNELQLNPVMKVNIVDFTVFVFITCFLKAGWQRDKSLHVDADDVPVGGTNVTLQDQVLSMIGVSGDRFL